MAGALAIGCSEKEGPVGAPGGRDGIVLRYVTPRAQVVPAEAPRVVTLAVSIQRPGDGGEAVPFAGALMEATLEEGRGSLTSRFSTADSRGVASFQVEMPAVGDRTRIIVTLEQDPRSFLPFEIVAAPVTPIEIEIGEIEELRPTAEGVLLRFPAVADAEYLLIPYQTDLERRSDYRLLFQAPGDAIVGSLALPDTPRGREVGGEEAGHVRRGDIEPGGLVPAAGIASAINIKSCRIDVERVAPLRYLGVHVAIYVDAPADSHQARIDSLGRGFDEEIFPTNTRLFGRTTDFDDNDRVLVIMSPELGVEGGVYCDTIRNRGMESFYTNWIPSDPIDRPLSSLAHEHQHVINAGYHVVSRGDIGDERWVNEGLSYAAEALNGYWGGSLLRVWQFLSGQNGGLSMLPLDYQGRFDDRYMMFMLYIWDRFGSTSFLNLGQSGLAGVANVEGVTGMPFEELLHDWFITAAVSNRGLIAGSRYNYETVNLQGMEEQIAACRCVPGSRFQGMTLEPLHLDATFNVTRTLNRADADFFVLPTGPADRMHDVFFDAFGRPTVRIAIVRSK
ncbi:MAG: hypothetical protein ACREK5_03000 [Gemmatimonadota bacterium]